MNDLAILIPNWDGEAVLADCLSSLATAVDSSLQAQVLVFDNGSVDGSLAILRQFQAVLSLEVIRSETNLGYAAANNALFERADAEFCLLLNNDTVVEGELSESVAFLRAEPNVGIAQGPILDISGTRIDSVGSLMAPSGFLYHLGSGEPATALPPSRRVFSVKGAAMYVRSACVAEVGLFDPEAFAYFEESDLCWRAQLAGWDVVYNSRLPVVRHVVGHSSPRLGTRVYEFHSYKNRLRSIIVNTGRRTMPGMLARHLAVCACAAGSAFLNGRWSACRNIGAAFVWNLRALGRTRERRRTVQNLRRRSDRELLDGTSRRMRLADYAMLGRTYEKGKRGAVASPKESGPQTQGNRRTT